MIHLKDFQSFLNENLSVPVYRDNRDFLNACINAAKKAKLIKKVEVNPRGMTMPEQKITVNGKTYVTEGIIFKIDGDMYVLEGKDEGKFFIFSDTYVKQLCLESAEKIFPSEASGSSKKLSITMKRVSLSFFSKGSWSGISNNSWYPTANAEKYFDSLVIVEYQLDKNSVEKMDSKKIMEMPAYKEFLEKTGTVLISDEKSLRRNTFTFAYPTEHAIAPREANDTWRLLTRDRDGKEHPYFLDATAIFDSGYIRSVGAWNPGYEVRPGVRGKFDPTTEVGWTEGFQRMAEIWEKWKKKWEDQDIEFLTAQERKEKFGYVAGKKFGF